MKYYFVLFLILIGFTGTAYGQYLGDKVPPKTLYDDETGETIFPPSYVDFYYSDSRFEKYFVIAEQYRYDIPYMISNGTIPQMNMNCFDVELVLDVEPSGKQGWITLALPRQLIDSKTVGDKDDDFVVLMDSKEIQRSDIASEKLRLLVIPFSNDTSQVNIIGVNYPEQMGENACNGMHDPPFSYLLSPLKQYKYGVSSDEIQCNSDLKLITKYDDTPACVKPESIPKLIECGWIEESNQEHSTYFSDDGIKDIPVLTANNNEMDYSVDEKGMIDLDKVTMPIDEKYGEIDYDKLGHLVAEYDLKKQLSQKNVQYSEQDYLFIDGMTLDSYPPHSGYCAFVKSLDGKEYWYGGWFHKDTLSTSELYDHNPNPCRPKEQSCACNLQKKLAVNNLETLSYFDASEEESVGKIIQSYLSSSNISNISNQFIVGKYNLDKGLFVTPFCGKFMGASNIKEFNGSIEFGRVTEFSLRQIPELCAINDDSTIFDFTYSGNN